MGLASVTPRRNRDGSVSWRVQFRMGQPRKIRQETFSGEGAETAARQFGALLDRVGPEAALATLRARNQSAVGVPTLREFTERYLDPKSGHLTGVQKGTRDGYVRIAEKSFLPILGDLPVDTIVKTDIGRWVAWQEQQESGRSPGQRISMKTVRNYHSLLSAVLSAAVESGHRKDNPARGVKISRGVKHEPVFLTQEEFFTLHHFIADYYKPLVSFLVATGCRWSEATALEKRDVNLDATPPTVRVSKAWKKTGEVGPPKSDRGRRTISVWTALTRQLSLDGPGSDLLFQGMQNGGRLWYGSFKTRIWDRAVSDANDPVKCAASGLQPLGKRPTPHDLRHTHASWQIAAGTNLTSLQVRMGHEKITTTSDIYGHLMPDAHIQMSNVMEAAMSHVIPELTA
jgi:integrase